MNDNCFAALMERCTILSGKPNCKKCNFFKTADKFTADDEKSKVVLKNKNKRAVIKKCDNGVTIVTTEEIND